MNDNLKELESIVNKLEIQSSFQNETYYEIDGDGTFIGFGLFKDKHIGVQRVYMSKGTKIPEHCHKEAEFTVCYLGSFILKCDTDHVMVNGKQESKKKLLKPGDAAYFPPNSKHSGEMLEDSWVIAVTIPAAEEYPDAQ